MELFFQPVMQLFLQLTELFVHLEKRFL
jgi:hypothetical protein